MMFFQTQWKIYETYNLQWRSCYQWLQNPFMFPLTFLETQVWWILTQMCLWLTLRWCKRWFSTNFKCSCEEATSISVHISVWNSILKVCSNKKWCTKIGLMQNMLLLLCFPIWYLIPISLWLTSWSSHYMRYVQHKLFPKICGGFNLTFCI